MSVELINQKLDRQPVDSHRVLDVGPKIGANAYAVKTNHSFRDIQLVQSRIAERYNFVTDYYNNVLVWIPEDSPLENAYAVCFMFSK